MLSDSSDLACEPTLHLLRSCLQQGVHATPLCVAIMGWLCGLPTTPSVAATGLHGGDVWVRLSDEEMLEPLCSFLDFLEQIRIICVALNMDEAQTQQIVALARQRLT